MGVTERDLTKDLDMRGKEERSVTIVFTTTSSRPEISFNGLLKATEVKSINNHLIKAYRKYKHDLRKELTNASEEVQYAERSDERWYPDGTDNSGTEPESRSNANNGSTDYESGLREPDGGDSGDQIDATDEDTGPESV